MPYTSITAGLLETRLTQAALTQLTQQAIYPRTAIVDYADGYFERGEDVKIRRPKRRTAVDFDPRAGALTMNEAEFFSGTFGLNRLWANGFPVYSHDPSGSLEIYINETGTIMAEAISRPNDDYMYQQFRTWSATTGAVALGKHAPVAITAALDSNNAFSDFNDDVLRNAGGVLDSINVPSIDRFAMLSTRAKTSFLGDSVMVEGFAAALNIASGGLIATGLPNGTFVQRYGFNVGGTNVVTGQTAVADLDTAASNQPLLPVASAAANTDFTIADESGTVLAGAVDITLTAGTALNVTGTGVAVGQIARINASNSLTGVAVAFGVILRIQSAGTTAPIITLIPYAADGTKLTAANIVSGQYLCVPSIPSVNEAHHREALLMATRQLRPPSDGSGAKSQFLRDPQSGLLLQVYTGSYDISRLRESRLYCMLTGSGISDYRKGVLMLSR